MNQKRIPAFKPRDILWFQNRRDFCFHIVLRLSVAIYHRKRNKQYVKGPLILLSECISPERSK